MISYLKGKVLIRGEDYLIVETNGIGYKIFVLPGSLREPGEEVEVFVLLYLKRETIELYGCFSQKEFELFQFLEKMPGIGPKTALALASIGSLEALKIELSKKESVLLSSIRGLGTKRKQRLVLELDGQLNGYENKNNFKKDLPRLFS